MSLRPSLRTGPRTVFAPALGRRGALVFETPRRNGLLAALPPRDYERLLPHLEPVALPQGAIIHRGGDRETCLYFLTSGIVSRLHVTPSGAAAEFSIAGSEGVVGMASFLGGQSTPSHAIVLRAGRAYRLATQPLQDEFDRAGALPRLLLRYTQALIAQTGQIAACNRHHSLEQRLCRWMLTCLDRLGSNEVHVTQDLIARLLGVRRQSITHAAGKLREKGIIRYSRGRICVLDRARLEAQVCECYAVVKHEYDRLLSESGSHFG